MDAHPADPSQTEFEATVLDQDSQFLANARALLKPETRRGMFFPLDGVPTGQISSNARFLRLRKEEVIQLLNLHLCTTEGPTHFHFSY